MKNPPLLFIDTETLGLDIEAPIWDIGAILLNENRSIGGRFSERIKHDPGNWAETLPQSFQDDYEQRFSRSIAVEPVVALRQLSSMAAGAIVCGSNPSFDMARLERLAAQSFPVGRESVLQWHYHPIDVPTMAHGWLCGRGVFPAPPWKSDLLSQFCGVDPKDFDRHTAYGDAAWCLALYRAITKER